MKNRFRDNRHNKRNQARKQSDGDDGFIVDKPTLLEDKFQQVENFQLTRRKAAVTFKSIRINLRRNVVGDFYAVKIFSRDELVIAWRSRHEDRQRFFRAVVADKNSAVFFVPAVDESNQPHLHIALLHEPPQNSDLVELFGHVARNFYVVGRHVEKFCDASNDESCSLNFFIAIERFAVV